MMESLSSRFRVLKQQLFDFLYADLNPQQREAVYAVNGPVLVLAGAGSGKTTVLVRRVAHLIRYGNAYVDERTPAFVDEAFLSEMETVLASGDRSLCGEFLTKLAVDPCPPWAILSITFTNKAAGEMKQRLALELGEENSADVWAGTFHSICLRILRKYVESAGLRSGFTIYDTDDSKRAIGECIKNLELDEKIFPPRAVMSVISRAKDQLKMPEDLIAEGSKDYKTGKIGEIYREYANLLRQNNAVDFDDIILKTVLLLQHSEEAREYYRRRFRYVCIDEYQDTNRAQFELSTLLSGGRNNLMVVGDDDQSIYRFRGATIENILSFDREYADATVVKLEQNYRSTQTILDAANAVIAKNEGRHAKRLWSNGGEGEKITLKNLEGQNEEARYMINRISAMVSSGKYRYSDFAILYRINAQSNTLEKSFARSGIPYRILGGTRFYERKEVKDIVAYLCVIHNRRDDLRLRRIINEPKRKIGAATLEAVAAIAAAEGLSMFEVMQKASSYPALSKAAGKLEAFCSLIDSLSDVESEEGLPALFEQTIQRSGYRDMLLSLGITELDRLENVQELVSNAVEYASAHENATLGGFLEEVALVSDTDYYDATADSVVMMTIHSAKGLEFPVVFLPGMEDGIFPGLASKNDSSDLEEERRLFYVAVTRAKEKLFLTHTRQRMLFGRTQYNPVSQFVGEIPASYIKDETERRQTAPQSEKKGRPVPYGGISYPSQSKTAAPKKEADRFAVGDSVIHGMFGRGDVLSVQVMGGDTLYEIAFDTVGTKKMMGSFARLKREM